ncbi:MAG TPA: hypothetical protein VG673_24170, partial [Actinomycetota bacterium]|nr:hypothetical protein [Actinomycetota bacterium]
FVTVDPVTGKGRNRAWRRYGTDRLVRVLVRVAGAYAAAHPPAPRPGAAARSPCRSRCRWPSWAPP